MEYEVFKALVGGRNSTLELYDPTTRSFSLAGHLQCGRFNEAPAVRLDDGKVLIVGGAGGERCADLYDNVAGTFRRTGEMNVGRRGYHSATLLDDGRVLVVGGPNESGLSITEAEIYDPKTGTFSLTGSLIAGRSLHAATLLQDGRALIGWGRCAVQAGAIHC